MKWYYIRFLIILIQSVPDPQSVTITSSTGRTLVLNGSNVTLTCSILLHQNILSELSLLMVTAQFTRPDGSVFDILDPVMSGVTYNFSTQVNSFGDNDVGNYTCNTTVSTCPSLRDFLIGTGQLVSNPIKIVIG